MASITDTIFNVSRRIKKWVERKSTSLDEGEPRTIFVVGEQNELANISTTQRRRLYREQAMPLRLDENSLWLAISLDCLHSKCECGSTFSIDHALSCKKGCFVSLRHNQVRNLTASLLDEVWYDVCV